MYTYPLHTAHTNMQNNTTFLYYTEAYTRLFGRNTV